MSGEPASCRVFVLSGIVCSNVFGDSPTRIGRYLETVHKALGLSETSY